MKALILITESAILMLLATMLVGCKHISLSPNKSFSGCRSGWVARTVDSKHQVHLTEFFECAEGGVTVDSVLGPEVYPGAGIGNSTGSAWGTSYQHSDSEKENRGKP